LLKVNHFDGDVLVGEVVSAFEDLAGVALAYAVVNYVGVVFDLFA